MDQSFLKTLPMIFVIAVMIGVAHYAVTGMKDFVASCYVALHAGWGALAFDFLSTLLKRIGSSRSSQSKPRPSSGKRPD
jgi:hypothetical protein